MKNKLKENMTDEEFGEVFLEYLDRHEQLMKRSETIIEGYSKKILEVKRYQLELKDRYKEMRKVVLSSKHKNIIYSDKVRDYVKQLKDNRRL